MTRFCNLSCPWFASRVEPAPSVHIRARRNVCKLVSTSTGSLGTFGRTSNRVRAPKSTSTIFNSTARARGLAGRRRGVSTLRGAHRRLSASLPGRLSSSACRRPASVHRGARHPASSERRSPGELVSLPSIALDAPRSTSCDVGRALDMRRVGSQPTSVIQRTHQRASSWLSACVEPASELYLTIGRTFGSQSRSEECDRWEPPAHLQARLEPSADHDSHPSCLACPC